MILTCPECATSYFVDDGRIPPRGRTVKCSSCGGRWKALPDGAVAEASEPRPPLPVMIRADAALDEIDFVVGPIKPARKAKPKGGRGLIIGVVVVGVVVLAGAAAVGFRQKLVELVPAAGGLFAAIGLPVNAVGLVFEGVTSKPILVDGRPAMAVAGAIRNVTKAAINAPPIRISLRDKAKATLIAYELSITNPRVPPGGVRHFAWNLPDPPAGASGLEIGFAAHGATATPSSHATPAVHAAPAPVEAKPLPTGSPDALPRHE